MYTSCANTPVGKWLIYFADNGLDYQRVMIMLPTSDIGYRQQI
jgi:hypothetical protein